MIKNLLNPLRQSRYAPLLCLGLGALFPFSLAPYHAWPIALISLALLADLLHQQTPKQALLRGWGFGIGLWGVGVSWLYVSIHEYGFTPAWLAVLMVAFVAVVMGLFTGVMGYVYSRFKLDRRAILGFAPLFVLFEWLKTWLFTGFPWLFTGYGFIDSVLVGYAPIIGVFGLSLLAVISAQCVLMIVKYQQKAWSYGLLVIAIWLGGFGLQYINWTKSEFSKPLSVSIIQGNIPQDVKWQLEWRDKTLDIYRQLSKSEWGQNLVIWPEAAVPMFQYEANDFLKEMDDNALAKKSAFVTGIPYADLQKLDASGVPPFYNSMAAIGDGGYGLYFKQRLVPFGEYVPFESWLRGTLPFFNLEMSSFSAGNRQQSPLYVKEFKLAAAICYEIAYPELTRRNAQKADFIATLSNDGWFGTSTGPHQHLQMVQMRAIETGKWIIRATNTGISGFISPKGTIVKQAPQFKRTVLRGNVYAVVGKTPYSRLGDWPVLVLCFGLLGWLGFKRRKIKA
ncbi:MAG: apolipoprotein N-acyltransferase [Moraxellaceae bacterium]|nr:apolipoprotein N-acyltransferase [Moraxellaceae bacterium]MCP5177589.1 apolipoprotein N-acyltransferase [Moraxellaceae bacterium]